MELPNDIAIRTIEFNPAAHPSSLNTDSLATGEATLKVLFWDNNGILIRAAEAAKAEEAIRLLLERFR